MAGVVALALPLGLASTGLLLSYLVSMGFDAETVALSPLGPSQSGRFYGINNLLETLLLVPSFIGAAALGLAGPAVAAVALVTIGGNRFGADGGGVVVLLAGYALLALRSRGLRTTPRRLVLLAAAASALALAFVAVDAATGGESHVTRALSNGPGALVADLGDRVELSVRRTAASVGASAVVLAGLGLLVFGVARARRTPLVDAFLLALAVSLLLNDTPADVIGVGSVAAIALVRLYRRPAARAR